MITGIRGSGPVAELTPQAAPPKPKSTIAGGHGTTGGATPTAAVQHAAPKLATSDLHRLAAQMSAETSATAAAEAAKAAYIRASIAAGISPLPLF
jgi:hypothetical protein